jgi:hypothetical protein
MHYCTRQDFECLECTAVKKRTIRTLFGLRVYEDSNGVTRILRITSDHRAEDIAALTCAALGGRRLLNIHVSASKAVLLNNESLLEAHASICAGAVAALILLAL